jgi:acyl-coenzyme A synthetase/AMP-(fatty) acid ligase
MYGQAETTARMAGLPPQYLPEAARSIGVALPGGRLRVELDGSPCAPLEEGELMFEGPGVMMGYAVEAADLAKGDLMGGRIATGDLGYQDERGLFYITGRKARFAKLFGWRISLDDVEEMLSHTGPVAAINEDDRIIVYTERKSPGFAAAFEQLPARLRIHPSAFDVRAVERIPISANGKIDYKSLPVPLLVP